MPKASTETSDAPKRAPRKRAVRRVISSDDAPVRRRTRAAAPRTVEAEPVTTRKAPAYIQESAPKASSKKYAIALVTFVVVVGAASWIGFSDDGQINVNERINTSNQEVADMASTQEGGSGEAVTVPVQNTPPAAISGIRPRTDGGGQPDPVPAPPVEETVDGEGATTTDGSEESVSESDESSTIELEEEAGTEEGLLEVTQ